MILLNQNPFLTSPMPSRPQPDWKIYVAIALFILSFALLVYDIVQRQKAQEKPQSTPTERPEPQPTDQAATATQPNVPMEFSA